MITGGLGALGILTAQWLAGLLRTNRVQSSVLANTAARASAPPDLYLISRTGRSDASALAIGTPLARLLAESAAMVTILRADVAESSEAAAALATAPNALGRRPIASIVHASGVLRVRLLHAVFCLTETQQLSFQRCGRFSLMFAA